MELETLSVLLTPYKGTIATLASITTILQFFSGVFICKDIYQKGNTKDVSVTPFLGGVVIGILMLQLGYMMNDAAMIQVNVTGITLNILYTVVYFFFSENKEDVIKSLSYGILFVAIILGYVRWENENIVEYRFSMIVTILMLALLASPLLEIGEVIKTQSAEKLPFPIIFSATIVTFLWLLYGIILRNDFMIVQNVVGFSLCFVQLLLCIIFRKKSVDEGGNAQSRNKKEN